MYGNHGQILNINLSTGEIQKEHYDQSFAKLFLGGNGLAAKLIYDTVPSDADPFGPENAIVFTVGPLTDTPVWGTSRGHVAAISPLTGWFADSNYGGQFGTIQKRTGFDAIAIRGASSKPVYILVTETGAEIKDGAFLWGKTTEDTFAALRAREGESSACASIGPAGENGVYFANIICSGKRYGAAGRAGMGAVMGSKNLKAVVVRGNKKTRVADPEALKKFLKERYPVLKENTAALSTYGTPVLVNIINSKGMLATRNAIRETFENSHDISGELIKEKYWQKNISCHGCPVACGKKVNVARGTHAGKTVKMPEYETIWAMGPMLVNKDIISIINANHECDLMGIDTISMGGTLAFTAECMEKGMISKEELGGSVHFAESQALVEWVDKTARRKDIGKYLSLGSKRLSEKIGRGSGKYLYTAKGLEIAGHSARGLRGMSLSYATSTRGGSHHDGRPRYSDPETDPGFEPQPEYIYNSQCFTAVGDSLVMCRFIVERGLGTPLNDDITKMVNIVTGWHMDLNELTKSGERIYNLERLINVQRGVSRKDDSLPYLVMHTPIPDGPSKGRYCSQENLDHMLDKYYDLRGWSREGIPTHEKLVELGLK